MSAIQGLKNLFGSASVSSTRSGLKPYLPVSDGSNVDFRRARTRLIKLYRTLENLADLAGVKSRFKLDLPDARSSSSLGLDLTTTAASLNSLEQINASTRSFTPFGPDWTDGSSALITIGGEYDGTDLSGQMDFEVRRAGTHGVDDLRLRVTDPQGNRRNINIRDHHDPDRQYDLQNGLYLTLGPGSLINRDLTSIQLYENIGEVVDTNKPLGGMRNDNPNLQFGSPSILNGSFDLNGESISVSTLDSINDVINRINQSNAGVTALFNAGNETIDFLQDTPGSLPTVDFQNDTSNFLEATKLDTAVVTPGIDPDDDKALQDVAAFSSVQGGNLIVNGQQISIDTADDSLSSVIERIDTSSAGVVASFDSVSQQVLIEAQDSESTLTLDSNGTGFFAAVRIAEGRLDPEALSRGVSRRRSYEIADVTAAAFAEINYLFRDASFLGRGANSQSFRVALESALTGIFGGSASSDLFGLQLNNTIDARVRGDFATVDRQALTRNLQLRGDRVQDVLASRDGESGLVHDLLLATRQALTNVNKSLGISGTLVDTFA